MKAARQASGGRWEPAALLTPLETDRLVAVVNAGGVTRAATRLGLPRVTLEATLERLRRKLRAKHTTHAAALLYPRLGHRYLPGR